MSGRPSGDLFGSFLRVMQEPAGRGFATAARAGASLADPRIDTLSVVVKSIGGDEPATIVDLMQRTGLQMGVLAKTLQSGVETGLIAPTKKQSDQAYGLTPLGRTAL